LEFFMPCLIRQRSIAFVVASVALVGALTAAKAQTIYRIVGADGKVTFSDKPPASADQGKVAGTGISTAGAAAVGSLPFELRQVVAKYPVTLYTGQECSPCGLGRALLMGRGVPFSERSVSTGEDMAALQRLTGDASLPVISIGSQRVKGFSDTEWSQYLDLAGYPKSSALPANYKNPPPAPLIAVQKPTVAKPETKPTQTQAPEPVVPAGPTRSNPAGISF
jgi:glutaredoxin